VILIIRRCTKNHCPDIQEEQQLSILLMVNNWTKNITTWVFGFVFIVFNATFNNISVISWRSVLLMEETGLPEETHRPVASHWQALSHNVLFSTPCHERYNTKKNLKRKKREWDQVLLKLYILLLHLHIGLLWNGLCSCMLIKNLSGSKIWDTKLCYWLCNYIPVSQKVIEGVRGYDD